MPDTDAGEDVVLSEDEIRSYETSDTPSSDEVALTPEYIYTTDEKGSSFGDVEFYNKKPRNDLSPPRPYIATKSDVAPSSHPLAKHDEHDPYKEMGLFQEEVRYIFDPQKRSQSNVVKQPATTLYENTQDDTQLDVPRIIRTECRCKNGGIALGYLDTKTGQKDCSPCNSRIRQFNNPNPYKNYRTAKKEPIFQPQVPLGKQVGVSRFGDVNLRGCKTGNQTQQNIEQSNKQATLNRVVNVDKKDSVGGSDITKNPEKLTTGLPDGCTLYDNCPSNVYGI